MIFFFFNDTATTEIYTLSLHDALPISRPVKRTLATPPGRHVRAPLSSRSRAAAEGYPRQRVFYFHCDGAGHADRKSTRLNSSHANISYAVFCLKKKKKKPITHS